MKLLYFSLVLSCLFSSLPKSSYGATLSDSLTIVVEGKETKLSLRTIKKKLKTITITLDDPVYKSQKTFDGFPLSEVLALGGLSSDTIGDEIVFTAKDGYSPNTSFTTLKEHEAVLTFQEHGTKGAYGNVTQGKALVSPAPFYLVWKKGKELEEKVPWPYQLVKIEVVNFARKFDKIYPREADAEVMQGFRLFKAECIRCHSLNLQGGNLGPELNSPKNITEYWDKKVLRAFIRDASSFRLKDKMPSFPKLTDADLDKLLAYFSYMKEHKL